ncbi:hypothetical protein FVER53590_25090 [Fusarium verticillioides]|nr:hypothetical protein FVER53590_25090 [Fusarium verticillioides]
MPKSTRGRKPRACDSCRRKKIQCDRAVPQCNYCQHHGLTCSYNEAAKTEGSRVRSRLSRFPNSMSPSRQLSPFEHDVEVSPRASDAHDRNPTYLEGLRLVNGDPFFSLQGQQWIRSRTGSTISSNIIDKYRLPYLCSTRPPLANDNHKILKLPDRQIVEELAVRFYQSIDNSTDDGHRINFQILIDASRSILIYLEKALPVLAHECFWVIIFYPMTAISTIFFVALLDNRSDSENERLRLLQSFTQLIRQIPIKRLTVAEISHLEFIEEVVQEMSRLVLLAL